MSELKRIAQLDRVVTLSSVSTTVMANGQRQQAYSSVLTTRAHLVPLSGTEILEANQKTAVNTRRYIIRHPRTFTPTATYRLTDGADTLEVLSVSEHYYKDRHGRKRFLELVTRLTDHG